MAVSLKPTGRRLLLILIRLLWVAVFTLPVAWYCYGRVIRQAWVEIDSQANATIKLSDANNQESQHWIAIAPPDAMLRTVRDNFLQESNRVNLLALVENSRHNKSTSKIQNNWEKIWTDLFQPPQVIFPSLDNLDQSAQLCDVPKSDFTIDNVYHTSDTSSNIANDDTTNNNSDDSLDPVKSTPVDHSALVQVDQLLRRLSLAVHPGAELYVSYQDSDAIAQYQTTQTEPKFFSADYIKPPQLDFSSASNTLQNLIILLEQDFRKYERDWWEKARVALEQERHSLQVEIDEIERSLEEPEEMNERRRQFLANPIAATSNNDDWRDLFANLPEALLHIRRIMENSAIITENEEIIKKQQELIAERQKWLQDPDKKIIRSERKIDYVEPAAARELRGQIATKVSERNTLLVDRTESHPFVRKIDREITELNEQLERDYPVPNEKDLIKIEETPNPAVANWEKEITQGQAEIKKRQLPVDAAKKTVREAITRVETILTNRQGNRSSWEGRRDELSQRLDELRSKIDAFPKNATAESFSSPLVFTELKTRINSVISYNWLGLFVPVLATALLMLILCPFYRSKSVAVQTVQSPTTPLPVTNNIDNKNSAPSAITNNAEADLNTEPTTNNATDKDMSSRLAALGIFQDDDSQNVPPDKPSKTKSVKEKSGQSRSWKGPVTALASALILLIIAALLGYNNNYIRSLFTSSETISTTSDLLENNDNEDYPDLPESDLETINSTDSASITSESVSSELQTTASPAELRSEDSLSPENSKPTVN